MHIMVNKRYMRKCDTCVGHKARINKLLLKKPPGLISTSGASLDEPLRAIKRKEGKERNVRQKNAKKWTEEGDEHRVRR